MYFLILVPLLLIIAYQDVKYRAVSILLFVVLFFSVLLVRFLVGMPFISSVTIINIVYIFLLMIILLGYFRIRFKSWAMLKRGLGLGDLIFWMIIAFLLSSQLFLIWFNSTLILALVVHMICSRFGWYGSKEKIPLAGIQALLLIPFLFFNQ